jgi:hypothetical protein
MIYKNWAHHIIQLPPLCLSSPPPLIGQTDGAAGGGRGRGASDLMQIDGLGVVERPKINDQKLSKYAMNIHSYLFSK